MTSAFFAFIVCAVLAPTVFTDARMDGTDFGMVFGAIASVADGTPDVTAGGAVGAAG